MDWAAKMNGRSRRLSTFARTTRAMVSQETDPKETIIEPRFDHPQSELLLRG
jgi:hypothetical protein